MFTTPRDRDPFGYLKLRSSAAQTERPAADAEDARRYLRRRQELFLCVLVALLGVLVARSIPLVAYEQEVCDCRRLLHDDGPSNVHLTHVVRGLTPLRAHPDRPLLAGPADLVAAEEGVWLEMPRASVLLADRCAEALR
jgi:hypothetical protein